ncbi:DUF1592 domain-containing protein [soil metagenome]
MRDGRRRRGHLELTAALKLSALGASSVLFGTMVLGAGKPAVKPVKPAPTFDREGRAFVTKYCAQCHGAKPVAGFDMTKAKTSAMVKVAGQNWDMVYKNVSMKHMPPQGLPQPTKAERADFLKALSGAMAVNCDLADPGRVTLRRLNRHEYDNTIRDLLGLDMHLADDFPSDDVGYGFDNNGDVLSLSPLLMEKYLAAAEKIANAAIKDKPKASGALVSDFGLTAGASQEGSQLIFFSAGTANALPKILRQGLYTLRLNVVADQAGGELPKLAVFVGDQVNQTVDVKATRKAPQTLDFPFKSSGGPVPIRIGFLNDYYNEKAPEGQRDRNIVVNEVRILGPKEGGGSGGSETEKLLGVAAPVEDGKERETAKTVLTRFAGRAFRRPATPDEMDRLLKLYDLGAKAEGSYEGGLRIGLEAVLTSPSFLYRVETDPKKGKNQLLNPYELASRLSYFLWSSTPDDRLLDLARKGTLTKPDVLAVETKRMLADPKSQALADNFAEQWLTLRKLHNFQPNPAQFPQFNEKLRDSMMEETKRFFLSVVRENRPATDFIDGKTTFVNGPLAKLYGIPNVTGDAFQRVTLQGHQRGGVLSQAAILAVTSNPTRTSPTKRGKWVLENILGTPPPPPPPGVGDLGDANKVLTTKDLRKRMEEHRSKPDCKSCHARMDPIGFGMENYDAIGRWRTQDDGIKIDSSGILPGGTKFAGPSQLKGILLQNKDQFIHTLADRLLTYGIGRGMDASDSCHLTTITQTAKANGYRFQSLIVAVVQSDPFRKRSSEKRP